ncbi:ARM repeat-containing protein [Piromyces finnis]|uniref:ARM repeat-containing protein n=1 Tax=Piromyces finnis TaxID=1754191 RepID=A0A1Y1UVR6_9FUNG|nr:ARM repeat-containing protein [Piromyces finnis]|eukprot:ORX42155.1 ARM repeat-containing protein [Piromyces finnis]
MGKVNNKKLKRRKRPTATNPLSVLNSIDDINDNVQEKIADALPLIEKLSSTDANERAWAAAGVANLIQNDEARKYLLKNNLLGKLMNGLTDPTNEVVIEAAGALRNLINVDNTICLELYNRNILGSITPLLPKINALISNTLIPIDNNDKDIKTKKFENKIAYDYSEQIINIIWTMSETSDKFTKDILSCNIVQFLMEFIKALDKLPFNLVNVAAQCLNTITEENEDVYKYFTETPDYINVLKTIASGQIPIANEWENNGILLKLLSSSILYNIRNIISFSMDELYSIIFNSISSCLDYKTSDSIKEMVALAEKMKIEDQKIVQKTKNLKNKELIDNEGKPTYERAKVLESHLTIIQLSLEILANVCSEDLNDGMNNEEIMDEGMEMDEQDEENAFLEEMDRINEMQNEDDINDNANDERSKYIINNGIIGKIITYCENFYEYNDNVKNYASSYVNNTNIIQLRSINALNNILMMMPKEWYVNNINDVKNMWGWLYGLAGKASGLLSANNEEKNSLNDIIESIVNTMWSIIRAVDSLNMNEIKIIPSEEQVSSLIATYNNVNITDDLRVRCVGVLGLFAKLQGNVSLNKVIGDFLINIPSNCKNMEIVCEALNGIYDAYGDKSYDYDGPVFVNGGYLSILKQSYPIVQRNTKSIDKRKKRELRDRADETLYNLRAFIQYKLNESRC